MNKLRTTPAKASHSSETGRVADMKANGKRSFWAIVLISLITAVASATALAAVTIELRVTPSEVGKPITVRALVNSNGDPVPALDAEDFTVKIGDRQAPLTGDVVAVPPSQDTEQRLTLMFVMDFTATIREAGALEPLQHATSAFVQQLSPGDVAGIIKFNNRQGSQVVLPFTEIVDAATTAQTFDPVIYAPYDGSGTPLFDAIKLAVDTFNSPEAESLPPGPKAIIVTADGEDSDSTAINIEVALDARDSRTPIFTIGLGDVNENSEWLTNLKALSELSGGTYNDATVDPNTAIDAAYAEVSASLANEYVLTLDTGVTDCGLYPLTVDIGDVGSKEGIFRLHRGCTDLSDPGLGDGGGGDRTDIDTDTDTERKGGGGALTPLGLIAGLSLLALRRRLRVA